MTDGTVRIITALLVVMMLCIALLGFISGADKRDKALSMLKAGIDPIAVDCIVYGSSCNKMQPKGTCP